MRIQSSNLSYVPLRALFKIWGRVPKLKYSKNYSNTIPALFSGTYEITVLYDIYMYLHLKIVKREKKNPDFFANFFLKLRGSICNVTMIIALVNDLPVAIKHSNKTLIF